MLTNSYYEAAIYIYMPTIQYLLHKQNKKML